MKTLERILLATDFSGSSEKAVKWSVTLAKKFNSEVILLHVISKDYDLNLVTNMVRKAAMDQLSIIRSQLELEGVATAKPIIQIGKICDIIAQTADEKDVNLILMGSGEKDSKERFVIGTTTSKVLRKADKPVWVVKNDAAKEIRNVLCPVDFSDSSRRALKNAIHICRKFEARLHVLNVVPPIPPEFARLRVNTESLEESMAHEQIQHFKNFHDEFEFYGVEWSTLDRMGDPATEILNCVSELDADLLVMGTHGRTGINRLFMGSVTSKVIRELPCSFITTKSEDLIQLRVNTEISSLKTHYKNGLNLMDEGFLKEAEQQFRGCIRINNLHIPAWNRLAEVYDKMDNKEQAKVARQTAQSIQRKLWDKQAELEIRGKSRLFGKKSSQF